MGNNTPFVIPIIILFQMGRKTPNPRQTMANQNRNVADQQDGVKMEELIPQPGSLEVGYTVFRYLERVISDKTAKGLPDRWNRNYELSRNKHWKSNKGRNGVSLVSANLLFSHRQKTVNILTDNNPIFNVARLGTPGEVSEDVQDALLKATEYWWQDQEQQHVLEKSIVNGEMFGCSIEKVVFNPDLEYGLGEVETEVVAPYHFGFYPVDVTDIQRAEAVFHFYPMQIREVKRRWPEKADVIKADDNILQAIGDTRQEIVGKLSGQKEKTGYFTTFLSVIRHVVNRDSGDGTADSDQVLVVECWCKDYSVGQDGMPVHSGFIRCITVCNGGEVVLSDRSNPSVNPNLSPEEAMKTYLYDKFPFSLTPSITDTGTIWGMSDYEQLEVLQEEINKTITQFTLIKDRVSRVKVINPKDSGVPNEHFTNTPGIINPTSAMVAQGIRYMEPPQIPVDLIKALEIYKDLFFQISGEFDMEQAQSQGRQVIAYKAIAALIERASTMLKGKIRNYGKMIRERGRMYLSHLMNWYTEERWISFDDDGEDSTIPIVGEQMIVPVKLTVVSGSTMPRSKIQEREEALELFAKGAIDNEALLKKLDWSDRKEIVKRMQAGPLGMMFERMQEMGMPPELIRMFQEVAQMEDKEYDSAMEQGKIPMIPQALQQLTQQGEQQPQMNPLDSAEIGVKQAQIEKVMADIELIKANVQKVYADIQVAGAGVQFDREKLQIEKAQTLNAIEEREENVRIQKASLINKIDQDEKGRAYDAAKFDAEKAIGAEEAEKQRKHAKEIEDSKLAGKSANTTTQGAYREKGMTSNNKEHIG